jgi:hypothetical protein
MEIVPRKGDLIWTEPWEIEAVAVLPGDKPVVVSSWNEAAEVPLVAWENEKFWACIDHWGEGRPWRETGIFEHYRRMIADGPWDGRQTMDEVFARYRRLDRIFRQVQDEGRFRTQRELPPQGAQDRFDIRVHVAPGFRPVFSGSGIHRFAMAYCLGLGFYAEPIQVHDSALEEYARRRNAVC